MLQVLLNLLLNAIQAVDSNGQIEIGCSIDAENDKLGIWIEDDGIGVPAEKMSKIFEPFFTTRENGTGLGLAIVKQLTIVEIGEGCNFGCTFCRIPLIRGKQRSRTTDEIVGDLRQLRFTFRPGGSVDLRVGRQILTWGTGDLLFINDLFPKDWVSFFSGREEQYLKNPVDAARFGWSFNVPLLARDMGASTSQVALMVALFQAAACSGVSLPGGVSFRSPAFMVLAIDISCVFAAVPRPA